MQKKKRFGKREYFLALLALVILVIVFIIYSYYTANKVINCGSDVDCFVARAQACKPAALSFDFAGNLLEYASSDNCVLTKKIASVAATEPDSAKELFEGKEMKCFYEKNNLNTDLIYYLGKTLADCQGDLVDAISAVKTGMSEIDADEIKVYLDEFYDRT